MKRKLESVLKLYTQTELAEEMGCPQSRIAQLKKSDDGVMVHYYDNGEVEKITYYPTKTLWKKDKVDIADER